MLSLLAVLAVFSRLALYDGLTVKKYTISSDRITEPHTFVIVSDLHATEYGENQSELLRLIDSLSPDAILMPGDLSDEERSIEPCRALMEALSEKYPCYLTLGNHERWTTIAPDIREAFASFGVSVLSDKTVMLQLGADVLRIHGVDDPLFYPSGESFVHAVEALRTEEGVFDILLSHRPEYADLYASCGFDLTVSGHAHGGQVRIPFLLNGLYAPHQGRFPAYAGGYYALGDCRMIVSRGLMLDNLPRVFNPPEIAVVTLIPAENQTEKPGSTGGNVQ